IGLGRESSTIIFVYAADLPQIKPAHHHPLTREFDTGRRVNFVDQQEVGAPLTPGVRARMFCVVRPRRRMILEDFHGRLLRLRYRNKCLRLRAQAMTSWPCTAEKDNSRVLESPRYRSTSALAKAGPRAGRHAGDGQQMTMISAAC